MSAPSSSAPAPNAEQPTVLQTPDIVPPPPATRYDGNVFGDYEQLQEIARGGMGVVYKAKQCGLQRTVALKMILAGKLAGAEEIRRFQDEARAVAQLDHPNIVAIYEVGEHHGQHFYSMEYVPGRSLAATLADGCLPNQAAARYMEQVARGIHYAHTRGILHRDLKPANILLGADDVPKITDFGLAKIMAEGAPTLPLGASERTRTGVVMGTPGYMAPEQASGASKELGPACDIYSLGAVLYELLTGRPPFKAASSLETILEVLNHDPAPPRLLNHRVDPDLETICLKCLEKDPRLRYPTAEALADDLRCYLQGEEISARSFNLLDRLTRALTRSQFDKEMHSWGVMLMLFAVVIFAAHLTTSILLELDQSEVIAYWLPRTLQFALLGVIVWWHRPRMFMPSNSAERLIWAVWGGYLIAYFFASWAVESLGHDHRAVYGVNTVLSGLAFFVMGCHVWGWCYVIGLTFMATAPILSSDVSNWAPFWFGLLWGAALLTIGFRYWLLSLAAMETQRAAVRHA